MCSVVAPSGKLPLAPIAEEPEPATPALEDGEHEHDAESIDFEQTGLAQPEPFEMELSSTNSTADESFVTASSSLALSSRSSSLSSMTIAVPGTLLLFILLLPWVAHRMPTFSFRRVKTRRLTSNHLKRSRSTWRKAMGSSPSSIPIELAPRGYRALLVSYSDRRLGHSLQSSKGPSGSRIMPRPSVSRRIDFFRTVLFAALLLSNRYLCIFLYQIFT